MQTRLLYMEKVELYGETNTDWAKRKLGSQHMAPFVGQYYIGNLLLIDSVSLSLSLHLSFTIDSEITFFADFIFIRFHVTFQGSYVWESY